MMNQFLQMLQMGNPQTIAMNMLKQNAPNNQILQNVLQMQQQGNVAGIQNIARNLYKEKGIDIDAKMHELQNLMHR